LEKDRIPAYAGFLRMEKHRLFLYAQTSAALRRRHKSGAGNNGGTARAPMSAAITKKASLL
jgi:hypothetical protein